MNFHRRLLSFGALATITMLLGITALPVFADVPHEDPAEAKIIFSGVALFDYYSATLDMAVHQQPTDVTVRMDQMPFANLPASIQDATNNFADAAKSLSQAVVNIDADRQRLKLLLDQSRFDEAASLINYVTNEISNARLAADSLERSTVVSGNALGVPQASPSSGLRRAYDNLLGQIGKARDYLDLEEQMIAAMQGIDTGTGATATVISDYQTRLAAGKLLPTELSLAVQPTTVFVGDTVEVTGVLKGTAAPLVAKAVDILVDSRHVITFTTDAAGHYAGALPIPYQYVPQMQIQALYHPQGGDVGVYVASLSDPVNMKILFYKAVITVALDPHGYPGRETVVRGSLDYGVLSPASPTARRLEISLDNTAVAEITGVMSFSSAISLPPNIEPGDHVITVAAVDDEHYAPSFADASLNVTKAQSTFAGALPGLLIIPGSVAISGQIHSELGPLAQSRITINLENKQVSVLTGDDGTFKIDYHTSMGLGLIGSDVLALHAIPKEPWNAALDVTRKVIVINAVNCGLFLGLLVAFGIVAVRRPGPLRRRRRQKAGLRGTAPVPPSPMPVYTTSVSSEAQNPDLSAEMSGLAPRDKTLFLYRILVKLIQGVVRVIVRPQQTLREFAAETSAMLGPLSGYFLQLTKIVEKLLYSQRRGTLQDAENGEQLAQKIRDGLGK